MDRWVLGTTRAKLSVRLTSGRRGVLGASRPRGGHAQPLGSASSCATLRSRRVSGDVRPALAEGVLLVIIQRQLGHADLGITSIYLRGIENTDIVHAVHERLARCPARQRGQRDRVAQPVSLPATHPRSIALSDAVLLASQSRLRAAASGSAVGR